MEWKNAIIDFEFYLKIERGLSENTVKNYSLDIEALTKFIIENNIEEGPADCSKATLQEFIYKFSKVVNSRSQARRISALKSFFNFLIFEKIRNDSPADLIESPKLGRKLPVTLHLSEIEKILDAIELNKSNGHRNRAIIETLYGSGLRVSELVNLTLSNLFVKENIIRVIGKGNKERLVPLGSYSKKYILIYKEEIRVLKNIKPADKDVLFLNRNGGKITRAMIFTIIKDAVRSAGISKTVSPHTFRHSFATHLLENGADLRTIQLMMGHESITTTEIYTHLDNQHLKKVMHQFHPRNK
ncbi:MAG: site-specific tyrosine recombinase XerD [Flavobacteriaceae bacterium]|nr:site-specific tyrosine recombinase XerD [Flavobacteriaceae bacterium]